MVALQCDECDIKSIKSAGFLRIHKKTHPTKLIFLVNNEKRTHIQPFLWTMIENKIINNICVIFFPFGNLLFINSNNKCNIQMNRKELILYKSLYQIVHACMVITKKETWNQPFLQQLEKYWKDCETCIQKIKTTRLWRVYEER